MARTYNRKLRPVCVVPEQQVVFMQSNLLIVVIAAQEEHFNLLAAKTPRASVKTITLMIRLVTTPGILGMSIIVLNIFSCLVQHIVTVIMTSITRLVVAVLIAMIMMQI